MGHLGSSSYWEKPHLIYLLNRKMAVENPFHY